MVVIDRIDFGQQTNNVSYGRLPDGGSQPGFLWSGQGHARRKQLSLLTNVIINEVLTHTDPPLEDAIELYNTTTADINIGYWWLSNAKNNPKKFQIPPGTIIPALSYKVFYEYARLPGGFNPNGEGTNRSFILNSARGDQVHLHTADASGKLTFFAALATSGRRKTASAFGVHVASDGETDFVRMSQRTFGRDNPVHLGDFRMGTGLPNAYPA